MAVQKQDDQHEHTFSNYVRIRDVVQKTCLKRWTIGKSGERGSGIFVLLARHDDDDDISLQTPAQNRTYSHTSAHSHTYIYICVCVCVCVRVYIYIYIYIRTQRHMDREREWVIEWENGWQIDRHRVSGQASLSVSSLKYMTINRSFLLTERKEEREKIKGKRNQRGDLWKICLW